MRSIYRTYKNYYYRCRGAATCVIRGYSHRAMRIFLFRSLSLPSFLTVRRYTLFSWSFFARLRESIAISSHRSHPRNVGLAGLASRTAREENSDSSYECHAQTPLSCHEKSESIGKSARVSFLTVQMYRLVPIVTDPTLSPTAFSSSIARGTSHPFRFANFSLSPFRAHK